MTNANSTDAETTETLYTIETRSEGTAGVWADDCLGDYNEFDSEKQAEKAIARMKRISPEWAEAEYRVVELEPS
jgi:hypothetical protein